MAHNGEELWDVISVMVSAMSTTLEKLDRIADRLADVAAYTEAMYQQQLYDIQERERRHDGFGN